MPSQDIPQRDDKVRTSRQRDVKVKMFRLSERLLMNFLTKNLEYFLSYKILHNIDSSSFASVSTPSSLRPDVSVTSTRQAERQFG